MISNKFHRFVLKTSLQCKTVALPVDSVQRRGAGHRRPRPWGRWWPLGWCQGWWSGLRWRWFHRHTRHRSTPWRRVVRHEVGISCSKIQLTHLTRQPPSMSCVHTLDPSRKTGYMAWPMSGHVLARLSSQWAGSGASGQMAGTRAPIWTRSDSGDISLVTSLPGGGIVNWYVTWSGKELKNGHRPMDSMHSSQVGTWAAKAVARRQVRMRYFMVTGDWCGYEGEERFYRGPYLQARSCSTWYTQNFVCMLVKLWTNIYLDNRHHDGSKVYWACSTWYIWNFVCTCIISSILLN